MMLRPRETRDLRLVASDLDVSPAAEVVWSHDVPRNAVATAMFDTASDVLVIHPHTIVDLTAPVWPERHFMNRPTDRLSLPKDLGQRRDRPDRQSER